MASSPINPAVQPKSQQDVPAFPFRPPGWDMALRLQGYPTLRLLGTCCLHSTELVNPRARALLMRKLDSDSVGCHQNRRKMSLSLKIVRFKPGLPSIFSLFTSGLGEPPPTPTSHIPCQPPSPLRLLVAAPAHMILLTESNVVGSGVGVRTGDGAHPPQRASASQRSHSGLFPINRGLSQGSKRTSTFMEPII